MASLIINRIVMSLRRGENVAEKIHNILLSKNLNLLHEIELFQDFENLKDLICKQLMEFYGGREGYIYIAGESLTAPRFKVGLTANLAQREISLNSAGVVDKLHFLHTVHVFDMYSIESMLHNQLKQVHKKKKEFFYGEFEEIKQKVDALIMEHNTFYSTKVYYLLGFQYPERKTPAEAGVFEY